MQLRLVFIECFVHMDGQQPSSAGKAADVLKAR
jgi:hypothetical protein